MNGKELLHLFGFETQEEPISIYPYSPVYRVKHQGGDVIIKRTQRRVESVMAYIQMLHDQGIKVVTPVKLDVTNPQKYEDSNFVVYPFIEGKKYSNIEDEIFKAGELLGQIHHVSPSSNIYNLFEYNVYDFNEQEVEDYVQTITQHARKVGVQIDSTFKIKLLESVANQQQLLKAGLPHVATPHDFKANNLVFIPEPYLIDPDNAAWLPRIFDLALVLLLFHNEHQEAPKRIFTINEWELFLSGYKQYVTLTSEEQLFWEKAKSHVFLDEVMWLMAEYEDDWKKHNQQQLFKSLIELLRKGENYII